MKLLLATIKTNCNYTDYAMKYLYSVVEGSPLDVEMRNYCVKDTNGNIYEDIIAGQFDIVYFQCNPHNIQKVCSVIEMIKKAAPETAAMAGGMEVSFETRAFMAKNPWVDYVIRGEAETVLYRFLRSVTDYTFDFENVPGLAYRSGDDIIVNDFDYPAELDDLPFPYEKTEPGERVIYYESMRGNAERLAHKAQIPDSMVRALSTERVLRELRYFLVKAPERVVFFDRCFNFNSDRAYKIFEYLINNDNGITVFEFNVSGENLDDETIRLLAEARPGLFEFNVDVASTNSEVLAAVGRRENIYQLMYNVTKLLQTHKVKVKISVTAGLPYESMGLFERSFNKAFGLGEGSPLKIDVLRLSKGTKLRADADKYGYLYSSQPPYDLISTDCLSALDVIRIRNLAKVVSAYVGDGGFKASFRRILADTQIKPFDLFSKLTDYICAHKESDILGSKVELARLLYYTASAIYVDSEDGFKLEGLKDAIYADLAGNISEDEVVKFERAKKPADEPVEEPAEEPDDEFAEDPFEEPAEEPVEEPFEELAEEPVEDPAEEPVEEPAEEPAEETAEEAAEEPAEEPVDEPTEKPADEPAEESAEAEAEGPAEEFATAGSDLATNLMNYYDSQQ